MEDHNREVDYRRDNYYALENEFNRFREMSRDVNTNLQVELSQTKDELNESNEYIQSYKKLLKEQMEEYKELDGKYIFVLKKLNNIPAIQKQMAEMIKYYEYMTSSDGILGPVLGFIAGVLISIIFTFYI